MKLLAVIFIFITLSNASILPNPNSKISYDNYGVYKIVLQNENHRNLLEKLTENNKSFSVWHSVDGEVHLMVDPSKVHYFKNVSLTAGINIELMIPNVQRLINEEQDFSELDNTEAFGWSRFYPLADIEAWLDKILTDYPMVATGFTIGKSYEGRNIRGIKISYKFGNPGIFIESNIHAREWITSATATWFINELLTSTDVKVRQLAEDHDWYIVPVFNVDGFVYTHEKDRLWRKTRQPVATSSCIGTDPNRNYDSHWMENGGASANPCAENYAGPHAFSEPEVKALADYVSGIKNKLNIMLAFHSYSQLLLSPYGHTAEEFPENFDDLMQVAKAYADAVQSLPYKTEYKYGSSAGALCIIINLKNVASGATNDWAYNEQDIKISYTIEFRDQGRYGFVLPPIHIVPNCEEAMAGILALVQEAGKLGYLQVKY